MSHEGKRTYTEAEVQEDLARARARGALVSDVSEDMCPWTVGPSPYFRHILGQMTRRAAQTAPEALQATTPVKREQPERREQEAIKKLLRAIGAKFWVAGTTRMKGDYHGTMQTPGLPDLPLVFLPRSRLGDPTQPLYELVVIEVKSPAMAKAKFGGLSPEQRGVQGLCAGAGVPFIHGDLDAILAWLIQRGYLQADQVPHYRVAKPPYET